MSLTPTSCYSSLVHVWHKGNINRAEGNFMDTLATELIIAIIRNLDHKEILSSRLISSKYNSIVRDTPLLQYQIALGSQGYEDGNSGRPTSDRLRSFRDHQRSWCNPTPQLTRVNGLRVNTEEKWMLNTVSHDVLIGATPDVRADTSIVYRCMDRIYLGSSVSPECRSSVLTLDMDFVDLKCDPSQLLLVVRSPHEITFLPDSGAGPLIDSTTSIFFLNLRSGKVHPRATDFPCLVVQHSLHGSPPRWDKMGIQGELFTCCLNHPAIGRETHLYRWTTGKYLAKWRQSPNFQVMDVLPLRDEYVLLVVLRDHEASLAIHVYSIPSVQKHIGEGQLDLLAVFELPKLTTEVSHDLSCVFFLISSSNGEGGIASASLDFYPSLVLFNLALLDGQSEVHLFVPTSILLPGLTNHFYSNAQSARPIHVGWTDWGPRNTRIIPMYGMINVLAIIGYRGLCWNEIWDFNPHDNPSLYPEGTTYRVTSDSIIPPNSIFANQVVTSLPYRLIRVDGIPQPSDTILSKYFFEDIDGPKVVMFQDEDDTAKMVVDVWAL